MTDLPILAAILFATALGVRHGLDWDHLTAIADLVGVPGQCTRRSLGLALWYCLGHGPHLDLQGHRFRPYSAPAGSLCIAKLRAFENCHILHRSSDRSRPRSCFFWN